LESTRLNAIDERKKTAKKTVPAAKPTASNPIAKSTPSSKQTPLTKFASTPAAKATPSSRQTPLTKFASTPAAKATPRAKPTPKYLDICDTDTETESSSDEEFRPDDTWNASSDDEYESEAARIKKMQDVRKSRKFEVPVFVPATEKRPERDVADRLEAFEYKKPPVMPTPVKTKRKLFTHSHYEEEEEVSQEEPKEKENDVCLANPVITPRVKKLLDVKKPSAKKAVKLNQNFGVLSFLKSLDVSMNQGLCDPEAIHFRNNFKTKKVELTARLFKLYNEKVFDGLLLDVPVTWSKKLTSTAGRCNNSRRANERKSSLELSDKVLTSADRLRCTLIHEMCHAITWLQHGENGHGATWKRWAAKANKIFPELPKIGVCHDYAIEYKYTYQCKQCKSKYNCHSKSKKVENIRCSICKGEIELFSNKKNNEGVIVMTPVAKGVVKGFPKFVQDKYKQVKQPHMSHKEVMQVLSTQFSSLSVEEKRMY